MILIDVYIYCPDVRTLADSTASKRANTMFEAIDEAGKRKCDIFLGPEFFFTHHSNQLGKQDPAECIKYSALEAQSVTKQIAKKSEAYPEMFIVMGTCFETPVRSSTSVVNNAYVYKNGELVTFCTKHDIQADFAYAQACEVEQRPGKATGVGFECKGLR